MTAVAVLLDACGQSDFRVSAALGIHPSVLSRYRSGERKPHARHVALLAAYFGCEPEVILGPAGDISVATVIELEGVREVKGPNLLPDDWDPEEWVE